jgi:hypothetical protein
MVVKTEIIGVMAADVAEDSSLDVDEDAVIEVEAPLGMPVPEGATFKAR